MSAYHGLGSSPELLAALDRAKGHKMTPQEIFEQRVSFVSEGRDKDEVRKRLIEQCGYPAEASEREAIVAWLRAHCRSWCGPIGSAALRLAANAIDRGDHLNQPEMPR